MSPSLVPTPLWFSKLLSLFVMKNQQGGSLLDLLKSSNLTTHHAYAIGEACGLFHNTARQVSSMQEVIGANTAAYGAAMELQFASVRALPKLRSTLRRLLSDSSQPEQLIHGDMSARNILLDGDNVSFVDLELCHYGATGLDLGQIFADLILYQQEETYNSLLPNQSVAEAWRAYLATVPSDIQPSESSVAHWTAVFLYSRLVGPAACVGSTGQPLVELAVNCLTTAAPTLTQLEPRGCASCPQPAAESRRPAC